MQLLHIISDQEWVAAQQAGDYQPPSLQAEGFIHCSTVEQVAATANRYYIGRKDLHLLVIDAELVEKLVKFEDTSGRGELFPHIYGPLNLTAIVAVVPFAPTADGTFETPAL
jgi:uncharacterized protein (DUF952 family)